MKSQLWAAFPNTSQPPVSLSAPTSVNPSLTPTAIDVAIPSGTIVISPGESLELRMYFWNAASTANYFALGPDPAAASNPDVIIDASEIPAPGVIVCVATSGLLASTRRRRGGTFAR